MFIVIAFIVGFGSSALQAAVSGASVGQVFEAGAIGGAIGAVSAGVGSYALTTYVGPYLAPFLNLLAEQAEAAVGISLSIAGFATGGGYGPSFLLGSALSYGLALAFSQGANGVAQGSSNQGDAGASTQSELDNMRSELEPAQATVAPDTRAEVVFGETAGLRPQPNDPDSAADLQTAREMLADISERNSHVYSALPNPRNAIEMGVWQDAVQASRAAQQWNLPTDINHFFLHQEGIGPLYPLWSYGRSPYATFGPFVNVGGGDVPRGSWTYIYVYRGVPR